MITQMQVRREDDTFLLKIPVTNPLSTDSYIIKGIEGLTPAKGVIASSTYASQDGGAIHSKRTDMRNIVLTIGYLPDYSASQTIQSLRQALYTIFPTKGNVRLVFINSEHDAMQIDGVVESFEALIFTKEPQIQISIICPNPHLQSRTDLTLNGKTGVSLDMSTSGSERSGFLFEMTMTKNMNRVEIICSPDEGLVYSRTLQTGDRLRISTIRGNKYISLLRAGSYLINELRYIESGSMDLGISRSTSDFKVITASTNLNYSVRFRPQWQGM